MLIFARNALRDVKYIDQQIFLYWPKSKSVPQMKLLSAGINKASSGKIAAIANFRGNWFFPHLCALEIEVEEKSGSDPNSVRSRASERAKLSVAALSDINGRPICISRLSCAKCYSALIRYTAPHRGVPHIYIYLSSFITLRISSFSEILYLIVEFLVAISRASKVDWEARNCANKAVPLSPTPLSPTPSVDIRFLQRSNAVCNYRCDSGKMIRDYLILLSWLCAVQGKIGKYRTFCNFVRNNCDTSFTCKVCILISLLMHVYWYKRNF